MRISDWSSDVCSSDLRKVLEREIDPFLAEPPSDLSTRILTLIGDMRAEWRSLDERINSLNDDLTEHARADEAASRLTSIPGIGVLGAKIGRASCRERVCQYV